MLGCGPFSSWAGGSFQNWSNPSPNPREREAPAARAGRSVGVSWLFRASGPLGFARPAAWGEGAGPAGSPRGAGLRLLGPNSPVPTATTVNPRDPQTSIFHLTVPPRPPGSEVPLSPAQLHRGHPGPQPPTQNQGCPSPWQPLGSAVAPGAAWQGTRQSPGCFSRAPLAFRMLSPGPCPQSGAPNRAALPSLRSLQAVGTQEITAELGLCSGPRSTRASPAHPGPPGPHPRGPWSTQASPTRPGLPRPYPLALVHPGLTHMGPGLPGPHPLALVKST